MKIQLLTSPEAISFSEVARVMKLSFDKYNYNVHIGNISDVYVPTIRFSPISYGLWDLLIMIHTFQDNVAERFKLYGNPMYTHKAFLYGVLEGKPILQEKWKECLQNKVITPSTFCKRHIESIGVKVKTVIPHGIIHTEFETPPQITQHIKETFKGQKILLYIGNGDPRKAIPQLVEALGQLRKKRQDWVCIMHTDERIRKDGILGGKSPPLDKMVADNYLTHHIIWSKTFFGQQFGEMPREIIPALYHACDLHLLPSYCEGFGIPLVEAGACHKTTVYIDAEPMSEIVHETCGYPVPYTHIEWTRDYPVILYERHIWDTQTMVETIDYALDDKNKTEKEEKNYQNSMRYDYQTVYRKFLEVE